MIGLNYRVIRREDTYGERSASGASEDDYRNYIKAVTYDIGACGRLWIYKDKWDNICMEYKLELFVMWIRNKRRGEEKGVGTIRQSVE